jgi:alpha-glucosidase
MLHFFAGQSMHPQSGFKFSGDIVDHQKFNNRIEFVLTNSLLNIYLIDENIVRIRFTQNSSFNSAPSYTIEDLKTSSPAFTFEKTENGFTIETKELIVKINSSPCAISFFNKEMILINEDYLNMGFVFDNDEVRCFKKLFPDEKFYGLGEKTGGLNKRGEEYIMWNSDYPAYPKNYDPLYVSIPFFIGVRNYAAYGIFFDNTFKSYFNMGASNDRFYWFGADKGEMDYYFIYGPEIRSIISDYTQLTGRMKLPPKWALGYQQSKWSYFPDAVVKNLAKTFRDKKIPCDVIYLDIDYMDGYRVFTWNKNYFPEPEKMLSELKNSGFKVIPIIDPGIKADSNYFAAREGLEKNLFVKYPDGEFYKGEVWPSWAYFPDFTKSETIDWWGEKIGDLIRQGLEGFWIDMNEPSVWGQAFPDIVLFSDNGFIADHKKIHNVYALQMAKATFNGTRKFSNKRHFILSRAGFSGIQKYSAVWTGDNVSNQDHLKLACTMPLGMGLSGLSFVGSDVGGFIGEPSGRLFLRWMQIGAFSPFFRGHSETGQKDKEPWAFGRDIETAVRDIINLRYRMLPYFYNEFYNSGITGVPVMRPLLLNYQYDENCYKPEADFQFMIGENLLVAPVLSEFENYKKLYLPEGRWIDLRNGKIYSGNQWIILEVPLYEIPYFLKEGGFLPMQEVQQYVGEKQISEIEFSLFPSAESSYRFYEDDGISFNDQNGFYSVREFYCKKERNLLKIKSTFVYNKFNSGVKNFLFRIFDVSSLSEITVNEIPLKRSATVEEFNTFDESYYFDESAKILLIRVKASDEINIICG